MMRKILMLVMMVAIAGGFMASAAVNAEFAAANKAYDGELYNKALQTYLGIAAKDGVSSELYYNIGNTYYRLNDRANAILYYERALTLNPANADARYNLDFVRTKAQINQDSGSTFFSSWIDGQVCSHSSDAWAVCGLVAFLLLLGCVLLYVLAGGVAWRKAGFFGGGLMLVLSVLSVVCSLHVKSRAVNHNYAIVMNDNAVFSAAPRQPKDKTEVPVKLGLGYKVELKDSIVSKDGRQSVKWYDIETSDQQRAWVRSADVEVI